MSNRTPTPTRTPTLSGTAARLAAGEERNRMVAAFRAEYANAQFLISNEAGETETVGIEDIMWILTFNPKRTCVLLDGLIALGTVETRDSFDMITITRL